ncbi:LytTR family DNA-binding domain-containing protein [Aliikangiella sp. G2MR2-5]|uniref:LytR/AlgR family response regulator transcription factor n=1 Tax=Aliikangiella sp. G2MR2-5 TaxID=2788943 RepID=UPI001AEDD238|nr:LytTR family DNA-binding domain-containing protein [Aliikangiella sp. G2MR2-5]
MTCKNLTAMIVDDEPLAIEGLKLRLEQFPEIKVIAECRNGEEAMSCYEEKKPDVVFLDLEMPGIGGLEVAQAISYESNPLIIFVTAYRQYAVDAFELNVVDYILKPVNLGRLKKAIEKLFVLAEGKDDKHEKLLRALHKTSGISYEALNQWLDSDLELPLEQSERADFCDKLSIRKSDNSKVLVSVEDIRWVDAAGDYMCIHSSAETYILRITMKKLVEKLNPELFIRIHKSTLVNISQVKGVKQLKNAECELILDNDVKLKASRHYAAEVKQKLQKIIL